MNVGSVFAYEPTHNIATNGATRQSADDDAHGRHHRPLLTSGASDI